MRNYDISLILSPQLEENQANDLFQEFVSFVQDQGGILEDQRVLGKRPLLAPIRHSKEGYLAIVTFSLNEENLPALEKKCKETANVLRFFIVKRAKKQAKKMRVAPTPEIAPVASEKKEEKIDLKDIDAKLEQIFKETEAK